MSKIVDKLMTEGELLHQSVKREHGPNTVEYDFDKAVERLKKGEKFFLPKEYQNNPYLGILYASTKRPFSTDPSAKPIDSGLKYISEELAKDPVFFFKFLQIEALPASLEDIEEAKLVKEYYAVSKSAEELKEEVLKEYEGYDLTQDRKFH